MQLIIRYYDPYNPLPMDEKQGLERYLAFEALYSATEQVDINNKLLNYGKYFFDIIPKIIVVNCFIFYLIKN